MTKTRLIINTPRHTAGRKTRMRTTITMSMTKMGTATAISKYSNNNDVNEGNEDDYGHAESVTVMAHENVTTKNPRSRELVHFNRTFNYSNKTLLSHYIKKRTRSMDYCRLWRTDSLSNKLQGGSTAGA